MTDEKANVKERLQASAMSCLESYDAWDKDKKDAAKREALQEAVHELRKVASRLEIDIAVSERDGMKDKPLPIPAHRSAPKGKNNNDDGGKVEKRPQRSKKPAAKKPAAE